MSKVPAEHIISGVREYVDETLLDHPTLGKFLRPVRSVKPVIKFDAPATPKAAEAESAGEKQETKDAPASQSTKEKN